MAGSWVRPRLMRLALLWAAVWTTGCMDQQSPTVPNLAQGGGGGPTVRTTDPDTGLQNTTIDVRVLGSGFDNGSKAVWAIDGDTAFATTKITTNSTSFVKSGELRANITIAGDAPLVLFDVVVVTSGGKRGIGIEKFEVKETGQYTAVFDDAAGNMLRSDNGTAYADGSPSYDQTCVFSQKYPGGLYQLRSIAATAACTAVQRPGWRYFKVDFGGPHTVDLDQDGNTEEAVEDAPARLFATDGFAQGATSTPFKIHIFKVNPDGSTEWDSKWELVYRSPVLVSGTGTRVIWASSGSATVDIYTLGKGGKVAQLLETIGNLPFKLTLTPMQ